MKTKVQVNQFLRIINHSQCRQACTQQSVGQAVYFYINFLRTPISKSCFHERSHYTSPRVLECEICKLGHHTVTYSQSVSHTQTHTHKHTTHYSARVQMLMPIPFRFLNSSACFTCIGHEVSDMSAAVEVDTHERRELIETVVQYTVVNLYNHTLSMKMS